MRLLTACLALLLIIADDAKPRPVSSVADIMSEGHSGKKSLVKKIEAGVKDGEWDRVAKAAATLKEFGEDLGQNTPEKGTQDSWDPLAAEYKTTTGEVADAVAKQDKAAATKALETLGKSCAACHAAHKD